MSGRRGRDEGSIYQRADGRWAGALHVGYKEGKRIRRVVYGDTRREVQQQLNSLLHDKARGLPVVRPGEDVATFLARWLTSVRPTVRPATYVSYEGHVRLHLVPHIGSIALDRLTPQHVRDMMAAQLMKGQAARSVQYHHAVLRRALGQALREGILARNVAALTEPPRVRRPEVRPLTADEARTLLAAVCGDRLEALYVLALALGLRQGEVLGLRWQDVDLDAGTLRVVVALQALPLELRSRGGVRGTRYALVEPKTARSRRTLVMPAIVATAIREHQSRQDRERASAGSAWQDWGLVFTTGIGTPLDARNLSRAFTHHLAVAGLPKVRFHDLRHSAATLLLAQGVPARVVMETLGHSSIAMTMNTYAHVVPALQQDAADRMDAVLAARGEG